MVSEVSSHAGPSVAPRKPARTAPASAGQKPSLWIWVPWVWFLFAATRQPARWLLWNKPVNFGADDTAGGSADRIVMLLLMFVGAYVLSKRRIQVSRILTKNKGLLILFGYMGASVVWSNFPLISIVRFGRTVGVLEMVLVVLTERDPLEAIRFLLRSVYFLHMTLSAVAIRYVRNIGVFYDWSGQFEEWIGLSTDKNSLGQVSMCSGIFWLWQICDDWRSGTRKTRLRRLLFDCTLLAITLWILRGSPTVHSATSIIGFVVCATALLGLQLIRKRAARAKRILAGAVIAAVAVGGPLYLAFQALGTTPAEAVVQATGRNMTFTDRNLIWMDVLNIAKRNPILGVGVGALWVGRIGVEIYPMPNWSRKTPQWRPQEAHNGYIDTYAQIGIIGLVLLVIVIWQAIAGALSDLERNFLMGSLRLLLLLGIVINNMSESSYLLATHDLWFLFLLTAVNLPRSVLKAPVQVDARTLGRPAPVY